MTSRHRKQTGQSSLVTKVNILVNEVSAWPGISIHSHRFGGREFRFGAAEVGHVHTGGILDVPFPRAVRDALLREGLAEEHRWVPNSGWITFSIRTDQDLKHAVWLMRLSYLRYTLKKSADPRQMIAEESESLRLNPQFKSLLEQLLPKTTELMPGSRSA
jgi:hypothetical protein